MLDSFNNINYGNSKKNISILDQKIETFNLKIESAKNVIKEIRDRMLTVRETYFNGLSRTLIEKKLNIYEKIIISLESLLPILESIRDSKMPQSQCSPGQCITMGGKK
jgi:hypothetical protein